MYGTLSATSKWWCRVTLRADEPAMNALPKTTAERGCHVNGCLDDTTDEMVRDEATELLAQMLERRHLSDDATYLRCPKCDYLYVHEDSVDD